jgi:PDZ domain/Aspartyl protease
MGQRLEWRVVKLQLGLFLTLTGLSLGLGFLIRDRLNAKPRAQLVMAETTLELPFEDYGGHLYVQGKINGTPTKDLVIDSGAADLFVSASKAKALGLQPQGNSTSKISMQLGSRMGALTLQDHAIAILPQAEVEGLEQYFGRPVSGILGYELFEQLVVEVDYQHQALRLHRPQAYRYQGKGQRIPLEIEGDRPYINATVTPYGYPTFSGKLMVDLGSNAALSLTAGCGLDQRLITAAPRTLRRNLATIKGANQIVLGRVQRVQIGSIQIQQPITIFGKATGEDCDRISGKVGYQILRQFKVILDYPHRQLILEPNPAQQKPSYDYDLSGLWLEATGPQLKNYRVGAISADTPAARAELQVGDTLIEVNNVAASSLSLVQVRRQLSQTGQTLTLLIQRKAHRIPVRLKLQPLI